MQIDFDLYDQDENIKEVIPMIETIFPDCDIVFMVRRAGRPDTEIEWATNCDAETACDIIKDAYEEIKD